MTASGNETPARSRAFRIVVSLFALASFGGLFGFAVFAAWFDTSDGGIHRVHLMAFGALFGVIMTTAFVVQNWRPERKISAFYQILDVALALLIAAALARSGASATFAVILLVAYGIAFALHPARRILTRPPRAGISLPLVVLTLGGAIPLVWFALAMARLQRQGIRLDPHVKADHWTLMAAMAIAIVLVGFLSSFRFSGWIISARCAAGALFLYGLISAVYPERAGSEGTAWALGAMAGALVFAAAAEIESRRTPRATS